MLGRPALTIVFGLEEAPHVVTDCVDDAEAARLGDWLAAHPEYVDLVDAALLLARRAA